MLKGTMSIVALAAAVAFMGTLGWTVMATAGDSEEGESGILHQIHQVGRHLHGAGHHGHHGHHQEMAQLIESLELTPDQKQRMEKIHEMAASLHGRDPNEMAELHDKLVAQIGQGRIDSAEIRTVVDGHVEQLRQKAYAVTDEMIGLVNDLDASQRQILLDHFQGGDRDEARTAY